MAITFDGARQWPVVGKVSVGFADLTSGVEALFDNIPAGAQITQTSINVLTAFDSGTSDSLIFGDEDDDNLYMTATSIASTGLKTVTPTGKKYAAPTQLSLTWTAVGTAATAGEFEVIFEYVMDDRANEVVPKRKAQ
jgi:hypothetical protein